MNVPDGLDVHHDMKINNNSGDDSCNEYSLYNKNEYDPARSRADILHLLPSASSLTSDAVLSRQADVHSRMLLQWYIQRIFLQSLF